MTTPPRRKFMLAKRRQEVAELYLQGLSQSAIAQRANLSQATVNADLTKIRTAWRESAIRDFDALRDLELERLNKIEREAWEAWQRSQQASQVAVVDGAAGSQKAKRTVKNQYGDARFLEVALRCNEARRKLLGLDAPLKISPTTPDGQPLSLEQRRAHIQAILTEHLGSAALLAEVKIEETIVHGPE